MKDLRSNRKTILFLFILSIFLMSSLFPFYIPSHKKNKLEPYLSLGSDPFCQRSLKTVEKRTQGVKIELLVNGSDMIKVEETANPTPFPKPQDNNSMDIFFNISSEKNLVMEANMSLKLDPDYMTKTSGFVFDTLHFEMFYQGEWKRLVGGEISNREKVWGFINSENTNFTEGPVFGIFGKRDLAPPFPPRNIEVSILTDKKIQVNFTPSASLDVHHYNVYIDDIKCVDISDMTPHNYPYYLVDSPYYIDDLERGTTYYLVITAVDFAGNEESQNICMDFLMKGINRPPIAQIDELSSIYYVGEQVYFTCRNTSDPDPNDSLQYAWDFNEDGEVDSHDENPSYIFEKTGIKKVVLRVTDQGQLSDTHEITLEISEEKSQSFSDKWKGRATWGIGAIIILFIIVAIPVWFISHKKRHRKMDSFMVSLEPNRTPKKEEKVQFKPKPRSPGGGVRGLDYYEITEEPPVEFVPKRIISEPTEPEKEKEGSTKAYKRKATKKLPPAKIGEPSAETNVGKEAKKQKGTQSTEPKVIMCNKCQELILLGLNSEKNGTLVKVTCPACGAEDKVNY